ncbi:hypothetical protein ACFPYM_02835, partial [Methylobacterium hispanicum]
MRYLIALALVSACALPFVLRGPAATVFSRGPSCEELAGAPELDLHLGAPEVEVEVRPREGIAALDMKSRNLAGYAQSGWVTNGLTLANLRSGVRFTTNQVSFRSGSGCAAVSKADIHIGFDKPVRILVPDRYREGSCELEALLEHEREHYEIARSALAAGEERFKQAVAGLAAVYPVHADRADEARRQAEEVAAEAVEAA